MKNKFYLQLFAEGDTTEQNTQTTETKTETGNTTHKDDKPESQLKYTDADVDKLINQKFAEWQKKQEKQTSEAERLGRMTAEEKANARMKALEDKLREYETSAARAEMTKQARSILQDKNIHVSDELLANLISEDADSTKASVESFVSLFQNAVEKAVKEALKSDVPRKGGTSGLTKEQILAVQNTAERQRLIKENIHLFK